VFANTSVMFMVISKAQPKDKLKLNELKQEDVKQD
jgi:hypothetical protein